MLIRTSDIWAVSLITAVLFAAVTISSQDVSVYAFGTIFLMLWGSIVNGRLILVSLKIDTGPGTRLSAQFIVGHVVISVSMMLLCLMFNISAGAALFIIVAVGVVSSFFLARHELGPDPSRVEVGAIGAISTLAFVWSWQAISAVPRLHETSVFPAWQDFFFHSAMITQFAHLPEIGGSWIYARGTPLPFYHYAPYLEPGALNALSGLPALSLATAFAEPFSFIVMGIGAWMLGVLLAGHIAGAAAIGSIFLVPSAAHYGLQNFYYNFHWLLQITTTGQAIGIALGALAFGILAIQQQSKAAFLLATTLMLALLCFKAQLFPALFGSFLIILAVFWRPRQTRTKWITLSAVFVFGGACLLIAEAIPRAPHLLSMDWDPRAAIAVVLPGITISESLPDFVAIPFELVTLTWAAFGFLVPTYTLLLLFKWNKSLGRLNCIPLIFLAAYWIIALILPKSASDEFLHRPFPLLYAVLSVWCASMATKLLTAQMPRESHIALVALGVLLLPIPFVLQSTAQSGSGDWTKRAASIDVPTGLLKSAAYIRENALHGDAILKSSDDGTPPLFGHLVALAERPSYVALLGTHLAWRLWGVPTEVVMSRENVANSLLRAQSFAEFASIARTAGIDWYVLSPPDSLAEAITRHVVFAADGYLVFRFP